MVHLNRTDNYWYLRRTVGEGKETVASLGKHNDRPAIYRPELYQDKAENVLERLPDGSADVVVTDPPYGIQFESGKDDFDGAGQLGGLANDDTLEFLPAVAKQLYGCLKADSHCYVFCRWDTYEPMRDAFLEAGFDLNTVIVWDKKGHGMGDLSTWAPAHEWIMHFEKGDPDIRGKRPRNVITETGMNTGKVQNSAWQIHPTQKPRPLCRYLIEKSSDVGDLVLDPFGGSYATARAAQRTFRKSVSCELDPETHRAAKGLAKKELHDDPEYGVDWAEINNLEVRDTSEVKSGRVVAE